MVIHEDVKMQDVGVGEFPSIDVNAEIPRNGNAAPIPRNGSAPPIAPNGVVTSAEG